MEIAGSPGLCEADDVEPIPNNLRSDTGKPWAPWRTGQWFHCATGADGSSLQYWAELGKHRPADNAIAVLGTFVAGTPGSPSSEPAMCYAAHESFASISTTYSGDIVGKDGASGRKI